jgi:hypothetical protein
VDVRRDDASIVEQSVAEVLAWADGLATAVRLLSHRAF